mmetsp:Transcript_61926/g.110102  ORF Transcript_61926/g.110102 Transcript_61926/m.110102 type:complete len:83 (-) Transcript_61926:39-287(-)
MCSSAPEPVGSGTGLRGSRAMTGSRTGGLTLKQGRGCRGAPLRSTPTIPPPFRMHPCAEHRKTTTPSRALVQALDLCKDIRG